MGLRALGAVVAHAPALMVAFLAVACCRGPEPPVIPEAWRDCAVAPVFPQVPPVPRTIATIVAYANANALSLGKTQRDLASCRARLRSVVKLVSEEPRP